ncbi:MAG: hypothetical protein ACLFQ5_05145 [Oceanicaulis sp.]
MDLDFIARLNQLKPGHQTGRFKGERWSVTVTGAPGDTVRKLYGERFSGGDHVSFNLYTTASGPKLRPCEMPEAKVIEFVLGFKPGSSPVSGGNTPPHRFALSHHAQFSRRRI